MRQNYILKMTKSLIPDDMIPTLRIRGYEGDLVLPGDDDYEDSLKRFARNAQRKAGCVAFVKSAIDASLIVKYTVEHTIPICIRGGGHNTSGASSIEGEW